MTLLDWVSLSSPVCWIAVLLGFLKIALRIKERAKYGPGLHAWTEADDERANANLKRATEVWKESLEPFTPEQQEAMWQRIRQRIEPPPLYAYTIANPLYLSRDYAVRLDDMARWSTIEDLTR